MVIYKHHINLLIKPLQCHKSTKPIKAAMPTYTGAARTSNYLWKRDLCRAAQDSKKITSFFKLKPKQTTINEEQDVVIVNPPPATPEPISEPSVNQDTPVASANPPSVQDTESAAPEQTQVTPAPDAPAMSFLDVTEDDNDAMIKSIPVLETVKELIADAKKYKSFTSLFHLTSLKQFIDLWEKYKRNPQVRAPMIKASRVIASSVGKGPYMARKIRTLYKYVARFRTLPPVDASKHYAHPSLLDNERVAQAVRRYLTVLSDGTVRFLSLTWQIFLTYIYQVTPLLLMKQVNNEILPSLGFDSGGHKISEKAACRWLAKLGYELKEVKKGIYVDGHEREDVVAYQKKFLMEFAKYDR